jgi:hypothetical protein
MKFNSYLVLLVAAMLVASICARTTRIANAAADLVISSRLQHQDKKSVVPQDIFPDFPVLSWGTTFPKAKETVEATGTKPVRPFKDSEAELNWDGKFDGLSGRASLRFEEKSGLNEIVIVVFALDKRTELFERWSSTLKERLGPPDEQQDNSISVSQVWRLKDGVAIELRTLKDANSPIVDVHWVKSNEKQP